MGPKVAALQHLVNDVGAPVPARLSLIWKVLPQRDKGQSDPSAEHYVVGRLSPNRVTEYNGHITPIGGYPTLNSDYADETGNQPDSLWDYRGI